MFYKKSMFIVLNVVAILTSTTLAPPADAEQPTYSQRGFIYLQNGDVEAAERHFRKGIQLNQSAGTCHLGLSKIYYKRDEIGKAENEIKLALKFAPGSSEAHKYYAKILISKGEFKKAIPALTESLKYSPADRKAAILRMRSGCYTAIEQDHQAILDLSESLKLEKNNIAYIKRAELHKKHKRYKQAIEDYNRGGTARFNLDLVYYRRAECYESLGQFNQALNQLTYLVKHNALDDEARGKRAELYLKMNQPAKALVDVNFAIDNYPMGTPKHLYKLRAKIHQKLGQPSKAAADIEKAKEP